MRPGLRRCPRILGRPEREPSATRRRPRLLRSRQPGLGGPRPAPVAASTSTTSRRPSGVSAAPEPSTTSPGRRRWKTTKRGELGSRLLAAAYAGHRSLLVPLDLLPRAERCPLRDCNARPGFSVDEDAEHLGERLILPPAFEHSGAGRAGADTDSRPAHVGPHRLTHPVLSEWPCAPWTRAWPFPREISARLTRNVGPHALRAQSRVRPKKQVADPRLQRTRPDEQDGVVDDLHRRDRERVGHE